MKTVDNEDELRLVRLTIAAARLATCDVLLDSLRGDRFIERVAALILKIDQYDVMPIERTAVKSGLFLYFYGGAR